MNSEDHFLHQFFNPGSIAVVGATNNPFKINYRLIQNLLNLDFQGKIYPVNSRENDIQGLKAFASLRAIPDKIDLVVTAVPATKTLEVVKDCDVIGVKNLVIVTGGFSEGGDQGKKLHQEIASFVKEKGIRTLGPNTLSPINTANNMAISYNPVRKFNRGGLSFALQSGFYEPKINWIFSHLGVNKMLDMGNKIDINEIDALKYFALDHDTRVIAMHIESLHSQGRDFFSLLKSVCKEKPTIILKSGRTPAGSRAASSHTGSIARENDVIFESGIRQAGAIRAQNLDEFFDLAKAFQFLELPRGNRLAIINLSGGEGVMATDACEMNGLRLARLGNGTHQKLKSIFPPWELPLNPFDAGVCMEFHLSDPSGLFEALSAIPEDENVDCAIMQMPPNPIYFMSSSRDFSEEMTRSLKEQYIRTLLSMKKAGRPFALWRTMMEAQEMEFIELLESHSLPVFPSSERAIKALSALFRYNVYRHRAQGGA